MSREQRVKWPGPYWAEPLRTENSWRVRRAFDGQNVLFRVSQEAAERFVAEMNVSDGEPQC